jgi:hypothetical protein
VNTFREICAICLVLTGTVAPSAHSQTSSAGPACNDGGKTVLDSVHHVCWLADANLAATRTFGVSGINRDGSMTLEAARNWVSALNQYDNGSGWLGHHNWLLPTTTADDPGCSRDNRRGGGGFGYNCSASGLGALYYRVLREPERTNVLPIKGSSTGPFHNLQPNLYWSGTVAADSRQGYQTFSFNTGWQGANTRTNVLFVLPMVKGRLSPASPASGQALEPSADGETVYDPVSDVTWVSDGNLAATNSFHLSGVEPDGAMDWDTAQQWVRQLAASGYAGSRSWQLPEVGTCGGYACNGSPLAQLYAHLKLSPGDAVNNSGATVGGFHNLQPYIYWACNGTAVPGFCQGSLPRGMGWNFSFANGFQGTALPVNAFYVLPYYPLGGTQ